MNDKPTEKESMENKLIQVKWTIDPKNSKLRFFNTNYKSEVGNYRIWTIVEVKDGFFLHLGGVNPATKFTNLHDAKKNAQEIYNIFQIRFKDRIDK